MIRIARSAAKVCLCFSTVLYSCLSASAAPRQAAQSQSARPVSFLGTVQSISGNSLTVKNDAGATMQVTVAQGARLLRIEPGQKNLSAATPLNLSDLQVGDRVLARGSPGTSAQELTAAMLVAIKKADIAQKQEQERLDWQRRGVGGLVKSVDPAAGTITISYGLGSRTLTIKTSSSTVIRRYAPGSIKFDEAKLAGLDAIKPGDQLRARGIRSADGQTLEAEEIISGSFLNIAGSITATDPASSAITVTDLATKKPVVIHITSETELKKLEPAVAQAIAMRMKKGSAAGQPPGAETAGEGSGHAPDPQQILARAPSITLNDLHKGSVVMLVATESGSPHAITAVTLVSGVEPMLQTSASGSQAMLSSAWNLGGPSGGEASQ